jgi:hypothetical protein
MTCAMKNISQVVMNTNHQVWKPIKIIKVMRELGLEGSNLFEVDE